MMRCGVCGDEVMAEGFTVVRRRPNRPTCRPCDRKKTAAYYAKNSERIRKKRASQVDEYTAKRRIANAVRYAVRSGKIMKPGQCQECGVAASGYGLHAHHADYNKPFEVEWLCVKCHGKRHRLISLPPIPVAPDTDREGA
jgi:hypothetical protein